MVVVDHFKQINDKNGEQVSDETVKAIASNIESELPEDATLGRLDGEEFAALLPLVTTDQGVNIG
jgi:diguanylate cyclase (GGDEF)-like protein